jgi:hypothetical protein
MNSTPTQTFNFIIHYHPLPMGTQRRLEGHRECHYSVQWHVIYGFDTFIPDFLLFHRSSFPTPSSRVLGMHRMASGISLHIRGPEIHMNENYGFHNIFILSIFVPVTSERRRREGASGMLLFVSTSPRTMDFTLISVILGNILQALHTTGSSSDARDALKCY